MIAEISPRAPRDAASVQFPGRVQHLQPRAVDRDPQLGDALAVAPEVGERLAEGGAIAAPADHQREGTLGGTDGAHAVVYASRSEPPLGDREALAELADQMMPRHPHLVELDLAVSRRRIVVAEAGEHADDADAGCVERDEHQAVPVVAVPAIAGIGGGFGDTDEESEPAERVAEPGRPPFASVEHELVALDGDRRGEVRRIARGDAWLAHAEGGADFAGEQRSQPALLLRRRPVVEEHLHVAAVGGVAVEDLRREHAPSHRLGERGVVEGAEPGSERRVGEEEVPQPGGARTLA